jgi:hypothetical protein
MGSGVDKQGLEKTVYHLLLGRPADLADRARPRRTPPVTTSCRRTGIMAGAEVELVDEGAARVSASSMRPGADVGGHYDYVS